MNKFGSPSRPLTWPMALLLAAFAAGCGGGGSGGGTTASGPTATIVLPGASATNPTVGSSSPSNAATDVATSTNSTGNVLTGKLLTATFSQPMDPATINSTPAGTLLTFTLKETTGPNVAGTVAMNAANTVATFTPAAALSPGINYTATVTTAAKNAAGTAMANAVAWSFTTKSGLASTAQGPVDLGLAGGYVTLAKTATSTTGVTAVTGNLGLSPAAASFFTGFALVADASNVFSTSNLVTGQVFAADYAVPTPADLTTAVANMETAFTDAAGRTLPDFTELGAGNISGLTLVPGLYKWGTGVMMDNTGVTLSGSANDVWIFQIAQTLTVANGAIVTLSGGAQAKNIFWQVSGQTTLGTTSDFKGIILGQTAIVLQTGAVVSGRLLAQSAVNLDANTVTQPAL